MNYYHFNGSVIASQIELGVLPIAASRQASIFIQLSNVPTTINNPIKQTPTYEINPKQVLIKLPCIGRFLIENGARITIEPSRQCQQADLCTFVLGAVWASLSYQQGKTLLKGALVSIENQNWLLSGLSPVGISTFALAMQTYCNVNILSDEFCSYHPNEQEVLVDSGIPALKLWQKSLKHFGLENQSLAHVRTALNKYWLPLSNLNGEPSGKLQVSYEKKTLHGIVTLKEWRSDEVSPVGVKVLTGFKALKRTYIHSYHRAYMSSQHSIKQKFQQDLQLTQNCKIASLTFKRDFSYLQDSCHYLYNWVTQ